MGEEGARLVDEYVVVLAMEEGLADPTALVADTTAQVAAIPYPNEMGLVAAFIGSVGAASKRAGKVLKDFARKVAGKPKAAQKKVREYPCPSVLETVAWWTRFTRTATECDRRA